MRAIGHDDVCCLFDLAAQDRRPMLRDETEVFVQCMMMDAKAPRAVLASEMEDEFKSQCAGKLPFALAILLRRLVLAGGELKFSPEVIIFVTSLCDSPAKIVLWAYSLVRKTRHDASVVTMEVLATSFPDGFPTEAGYSAAWDKQKLRGEQRGSGMNDNWLDTSAAWAA